MQTIPQAASCVAGNVLSFPVRKCKRRTSRVPAARARLAEVVELRTVGERNALKRIETTRFDIVSAAMDAKEAVCAVALFLNRDGSAQRVLTCIEPEFAGVLAPYMQGTLDLLRNHAKKAEVLDARR